MHPTWNEQMNPNPPKSGDMEWLTIGILILVYLGFALATTYVAAFSLPLAMVLLVWIIAQYSSLQHEALHGHPFRNRVLNEALVFPGLTLIVPYGRFRDLHLAHHQDEVLTDPYDDPETNYLDPAVWAGLSPAYRLVLRLNNTLLGRILIGPLRSIIAMIKADIPLARAGDRAVRSAWARHVPGVGLVLGWLWLVGSMPIWAYVIAAYLGYGMLKIRTFAEHQAHVRASGRSVVIEDRGPLALLFLNNNLHVVHHMHPTVAWYRLPALYAANRERYLTRNGGYRFASYGALFRSHFLKAKDPVPHPIWRRP